MPTHQNWHGGSSFHRRMNSSLCCKDAGIKVSAAISNSEKLTVEISGIVWYNDENFYCWRSYNDKNTIRLPWEHNIELRNLLEPQRLFGTSESDLHHTYTTSKWSLDLTHEYR